MFLIAGKEYKDKKEIKTKIKSILEANLEKTLIGDDEKFILDILKHNNKRFNTQQLKDNVHVYKDDYNRFNSFYAQRNGTVIMIPWVYCLKMIKPVPKVFKNQSKKKYTRAELQEMFKSVHL
jgi:hypothetical protein